MNQLFSIRSILVVVLGLLSTQVSARTISDLDAVHNAAVQRTLVMRIAKDHLQLAANVDYHATRADLEASIDEYEYLLGQLELNSPNSSLNQRVLNVKQEWVLFRAMVETTASVDTAAAVMDAANDLLVKNDLLMREWQARLPGLYGDRIDLAQQQSMLSERISALYMAQYLGADAAWLMDEMDHTVAAYEAGMEELRMASKDAAVDPLIVAQLSSNWDYAQLGLEQFSQGQYVPVVMSVTMESMTKQTDTLASAYHIRDRIAMNGGVSMESSLAANLNH